MDHRPHRGYAINLYLALNSWYPQGRMRCRGIQRGMLIGMVGAVIALRLMAADIQQDPATASYHVTRYTTEQGLPQNNVRALLQTQDGYLWIGTLAGLARFDGVRFKVFNLSNTPEMPNDAIDALAEDRRDGSLWINAGQRVLRYYQNGFESYDEQNGFPTAFGNLWPARGGGLWYSPHPGQLALLQNHTVKPWQLLPRRTSADGDEIMAHQIMEVAEDNDGSVLVLMYTGLFRFEPATGGVARIGPPNRSETSYRHFIKQADGTIFVAAREGLWRGNQNRWDLVEPVLPGHVQCPVRIVPVDQGEFWIAWGGTNPWNDEKPPRLARFRGDRSELLDLTLLPDYPMNVFLQDREGHLWIGTKAGLCQLRPSAVQVYAREQGLRNDDVRSLTQGPDGTIWLGTTAGLCGIKDGQVTNLPPVEPPSNWGLPEGLLVDRQSRVWYGARRNTLATFDHGSWISPAPLSLGENWVRTLYEDRSGRIWAGFDRGVAWMNETGAVQVLAPALSNADVRVIHEDRRGDFWFGTYGGGLNRLHKGEINAFSTSLGEHNNRMWWIHEDVDGVFWIGTRNGLNRFVPPEVEMAGFVSAGQGMASKRVANLDEAKPAKAGTTNQDRFFTFTTRHGLRENTINNIQEDDFGCLWLSGMQGIYRVARQELNEVAAGRLPRAQVIAFGEADGMLNCQCNGGVIQPSGVKDQAGRIWFPTVRGVAMVDPRSIRRNDVPPPVVIEQVLADETIIFGDGWQRQDQAPPPSPQPSTVDRRPSTVDRRPSTVDRRPSTVDSRPSTPHLSPGRARVLEIHYTANSFAAFRRMRFKYWLEGHDQDWRFDEDNRRVAFYTNLRPGSYTFHVTACNNHGLWNETPAQFAFILAPHFWQTWRFYILTGAALIGLAAAWQAYRLRWQRRLLKLEHQQALADERTRIARDLHDDLGTALTGLALELDVARRDAGTPATLTQRLVAAAGRTRALAERMREVVWVVNPRCDNVPSVAGMLEQLASQFLDAAGIRVHLEFPEDIPPLPLDSAVRHQLALGVREALTNVVRHAAASEVELTLTLSGHELVVIVRDNGKGFTPDEGVESHHGLRNLAARMTRIGGSCQCASIPGAGTTVTFRVPLSSGTTAPNTNL